MAEIITSNPLNEASKSHSQNHSTFDLSFNFLHTPLFAKYAPIFAREFVPDDGPISFRPQFDTRSYTLRAPLMQNVKKKVDYFQVPLQAILPFNWEKLYVNPVKGDDVDASLVNTVITSPYQKLVHVFESLFSAVGSKISAKAPQSEVLKAIFRCLLFGELFFSDGSLLAHLGVHYGYRLQIYAPAGAGQRGVYLSFDSFMDWCLGRIMAAISSSDSRYLRVDIPSREGAIRIDSAVTMRSALELMRSEPAFEVYPSSDGWDFSIFNSVFASSNIVAHVSVGAEKPLNYGRCVAYQLACAHFYTNDKIDYIFSAELYRQHIKSLIFSFMHDTLAINPNDFYFEYNGSQFEYDYLSGCYISAVLGSFVGDITAYWSYCYSLFQSIFGFNNSLRFQDYFVGAKSNPRAVGDVNVQVNNNLVSVVDITQNTAKQRFLNAVNRVGMRIDEYIRGLFPGLGKFQPDMHDPQWLASSQDDVFTSEVENTGEEQISAENSVTAVFRANSNNYEFTYYGDRPAYIVGIEYFDIRRAYFTTQDRNTMAVDRYDMFIPDMQFVGDQDVNMGELFAGASPTPFAYTLRDMQFKQFYDEACGGFVEKLPGWAFLFNPYRDLGAENLRKYELTEVPIKPSFIRSNPTELDQFYVSLEGFSPASYFHFIEKISWHISAKRPMIYAPEIL